MVYSFVDDFATLVNGEEREYSYYSRLSDAVFFLALSTQIAFFRFTLNWKRILGAGKSSVIGLIVDALKGQGITVEQTREPGGTPMAEAIRECVKHAWEEQVAEETELLLMYAARVQLLTNKITPALERGHWVVGDRHDLSSQAYQGGGRGVNQSTMSAISDIALKGFKPDLTIYLDVEPAEGLSRARGRGELDRIEQAGLAFFERTRARYLELAEQDENIYVVSAMQPMEDVHKDVLSAVATYLSRNFDTTH